MNGREYSRNKIISTLMAYYSDEQQAKKCMEDIWNVIVGPSLDKERTWQYSTAETVAAGYSVVYYGPSFIQVEQNVGRKSLQSDPVRCGALVHTAFHRLTKEGDTGGSTRIPLDKILMTCWKIEKKAGVFTNLTPPLYLAGVIYKKAGYMCPDYKIFEESDGVYIEDGELSRAEDKVARALKRLVKNAPCETIPQDMIDAVEEEFGVMYDPYQRRAFRILDKGVGILTGGPGTGKTTVLRGLIAVWKLWQGTEIICAAPSNTAAKQMQEATGDPATTIHKALDILPFETGMTYKQIPRDLPKGCLFILDEASMVDIRLFSQIAYAVDEAEGQLIIVGDEDQLQSVGPGNVLRDIITSERFEMARLKVIHRQADDAASIVKNAARIREGNWNLETDNFFTLVQYTGEKSEKQTMDQVVATYTRYLEEHPWMSRLDLRIFCPVRTNKYTDKATGFEGFYNISAKYFNLALHAYYANDIDIKQRHRANGYFFWIGDPVMFEGRNSDQGLSNGDKGIVTYADPKRICVKWTDDEIGEIDLTQASRAGLVLAYATSVHKAQGGQAPVAIIALPDYKRTRCLLTRQMLYVGVTRAEKRCFIISEGDALIRSIMTDTKDKRKTGLVQKLGKPRKRRDCYA